MAQYRTAGGGIVTTYTAPPNPSAPEWQRGMNDAWRCDACGAGDSGYRKGAAGAPANTHAGKCRRIPNT